MWRPPRPVTRAVNCLVVALLRSRLHRVLSRRVLLLTFTGRRSSRTFTIPVNYWREDDRVLIRTRSTWWKNLEAGAPVTVLVEGHEHPGWATVASGHPRAAAGGRSAVVIRIELRTV